MAAALEFLRQGEIGVEVTQRTEGGEDDVPCGHPGLDAKQAARAYMLCATLNITIAGLWRAAVH